MRADIAVDMSQYVQSTEGLILGWLVFGAVLVTAAYSIHRIIISERKEASEYARHSFTTGYGLVVVIVGCTILFTAIATISKGRYNSYQNVVKETTEDVAEQFKDQIGLELQQVCDSTDIPFTEDNIRAGYKFSKIQDTTLCNTVTKRNNEMLEVVSRRAYETSYLPEEYLTKTSAQSLIDLQGVPTMVYYEDNTHQFDHNLTLHVELEEHNTGK